MHPRVLIVGSDKIHAIEIIYEKYLRELGFVTEIFPIQRHFYDHYYKNLVSKISFRLGLSGIIRSLNNDLLTFIEQTKPDVIWVFKGMEVLPDTLRMLSDKFTLVNYNPDSPFIFTGAGSGNRNVVDSISLYHHHFTYNLQIKKRLERELEKQVEWLPFGFDVEDCVFKQAGKEPEIRKLCFLGNPDRQRINHISKLAGFGVKIDIYGHDWGRYIRNKNIEVHAPVFGEPMWYLLRKYRVQLNLLRIHNLGSHNMRTFEVPGIGGIMLTQSSEENSIFFNGDEVNEFDSALDCARKAAVLMEMGEEEALAMRHRARTKSLQSGYTYKARAETVGKIFDRIA